MEIKILDKQGAYLKGKKENVLINPNKELRNNGKFQSRVYLFTSDNYNGMGFESEIISINGPGEYEIGGVEIDGYGLGDNNNLYVINIDGVKIVFLGDLDEPLSDKRVEKIESADVLMASVLIKNNSSAKLVLNWAKKWGVNYLIPMGYDNENDENLKKFLDEADEEGLEPVDFLKVEKNDLPDGLELKVLKKV